MNIINWAIHHELTMTMMTSELKERATKEYQNALLMPRKKKKKAKKSARLLFSIAQYGEDNFTIFNFK